MQVSGISKTGQEFTVEVLVSSFVIEGEIFYTGIISELNTGQGLSRQVSSASLTSEAEIRERHQKVGRNFVKSRSSVARVGNGHWCSDEDSAQTQECGAYEQSRHYRYWLVSMSHYCRGSSPAYCRAV